MNYFDLKKFYTVRSDYYEHKDKFNSTLHYKLSHSMNSGAPKKMNKLQNKFLQYSLLKSNQADSDKPKSKQNAFKKYYQTQDMKTLQKIRTFNKKQFQAFSDFVQGKIDFPSQAMETENSKNQNYLSEIWNPELKSKQNQCKKVIEKAVNKDIQRFHQLNQKQLNKFEEKLKLYKKSYSQQIFNKGDFGFHLKDSFPKKQQSQGDNFSNYKLRVSKSFNHFPNNIEENYIKLIKEKHDQQYQSFKNQQKAMSTKYQTPLIKSQQIMEKLVIQSLSPNIKFGAYSFQEKIENNKDIQLESDEINKRIKQRFREINENICENKIEQQKLEKEGKQNQYSVLTQQQEQFLLDAREGNLANIHLSLKYNPKLVQTKGNCNTTALHWAAKRNYLDLIELLLNFNANIEAQDSLGRTPLDIAINHKNYQIAKVIFQIF